MKRMNWCSGVVSLILCCGIVRAEGTADDPLLTLLYPPTVLIQHRLEIGLTDEQVNHIRVLVEEAGPRAEDLQMRLGEAMRPLAELLTAETVEEGPALKRLDEILAIEKDIKHLHLQLMIRIRNGLTTDQRQVAARIQRTPLSTIGTEQRLKAKIEKIKTGVRSQAEAGQPPNEIFGMMHKFPELMENNQVKEAEALLDRVLEMLRLDQADNGSHKRGNSVAPPIPSSSK